MAFNESFAQLAIDVVKIEAAHLAFKASEVVKRLLFFASHQPRVALSVFVQPQLHTAFGRAIKLDWFVKQLR